VHEEATANSLILVEKITRKVFNGCLATVF
jgi:hypothetical protein